MIELHSNMNVPDLLKTGRNPCMDSTLLELDFDERLITIIALLLEKAMDTASKYTDHSNRNTVTDKDVMIALKYEAHEFFERDELDADFQRMMAYIVSIFQSEESDDIFIDNESTKDDDDEKKEKKE